MNTMMTTKMVMGNGVLKDLLLRREAPGRGNNDCDGDDMPCPDMSNDW